LKLEEPVHFRALITTAAATVVCVAACSKPPAPIANGAPASLNGAGRDLRLGSSLTPDAPVVSDLEAGRTPKPRLTAPVEQYRSPETVKLSKAHALAAVALARPKLAMPAVAPTVTQTSHALAMAPTAESAHPTLVVGGGLNSAESGDGAFGFAGGRRGGVIIRGGVGGPDDDCDIRHPRSHGGIAVNSAAPGFGGGRVTTTPRYPH
jgi:hypothetical protein